jgi:GrpB-like predicted nucleotidyltransferase (UPF0157 family)
MKSLREYSMTKIGLARGVVELVPHQPKWHELFTQEATLIKQAVGNEPVEHVGSTAVPGIPAKPIIDIAVQYHSKEQASAWIASLEKIGYQYKGEQGVANRFFFVKGPEEKRPFYLHVVDETEFKRLIGFRDKLRNDTKLAQEYSDIKMELAKGHPNDRKAYTHAKDEFIRKILEEQ